MSERLADKIALITGAAKGQGEAEARLFARQGATVVLTDVLTSQGEAVAAGIGEAAAFHTHDVGPLGIRVNSVHPGIINTDMLGGEVAQGLLGLLQSKIPLGRIAESDEVASLVAFLASDESSYCSGSEFTVDGGFTAGPYLNLG